MELGIDKKIKAFFNNKKVIYIFVIVLVVLVAIAVRVVMMNKVSNDYSIFLSKWMDIIRENGGFRSLGMQFADYNIAYVFILAILSYIPLDALYTIKIVSIIFDFVVAIYSARIVLELTKKNKNAKLFALLTFVCVIMLPTVFLNSAAWAQCDSIYNAFIIMSIYYLIKSKNLRAFIFLGIAFSFKMQTLFILPVYLLMYFKRKDISLIHFLLIPLMYLISILPAVIMGRSIMSCLLIYFNQVGTYTALTMNFPNFYTMVPEFMDNMVWVLSLLTFVILLVPVIYIMYKDYKISNKSFLNLAILFTLLLVFFMPRMHERYNYLAEVLSVVYIFVNRKNILVPILIQLGGLTGYIRYFADIQSEQIIKIGSVMLFAAIIILGKDTMKTLAQENEDESALTKVQN